jgi:hypothetical protein
VNLARTAWLVKYIITVAGFQNARSVFILLAISQFSFSFARLVVCWIASAVGQSHNAQILVRLAKESQQRAAPGKATGRILSPTQIPSY